MKRLIILFVAIVVLFQHPIVSHAQEATPDNTQDSYYIYPIPGIADGSKDQVKTELINQRYEVSCTTPKRSILGEIGPSDLLKYLTPGEVLTVESSETIDYSSGTVPLWRNGQNKDELFGSLETYWSYKDITETDPQKAQINSAPIYSLLTLEQQCEQQLHMLEVINTMCSKLQDPDRCALYTDIPGFEGEYTTKNLYQLITENNVSCEDTLYNKTSEQTCRTWEGGVRVHEGYCEQRKVGDSWQEQVCKNGYWDDPGEADCLQEPVSNIPLYLDKAYRLAFLVVTTEMKDNGPSAFFNFLNSKGDADPTHEVRVIAFRLPDFVSNKNPESDVYYQDALQLTSSTLKSISEQERDNEDIQNEIVERLNPDTGESLIIAPINCFGEECGTTTVQALVDLINDNGMSCQANPQDLPYEKANDITDDLSLEYAETPEELNNVNETPTKLKENQDIDQTIDGTDEEGGFNFIAQFYPDNNQTSSDSQIVSYLVYPYGTDIRDVEETLIGLVHGLPAVEAFQNNPDEYPQFYKLSDILNEYSSGKAWTSVANRVPSNHSCLNGIDIETNAKCQVEITTKADNETDHEPRIPGGWLGRITRDIQQTLQAANSDINEWIESLKGKPDPTELFLAGGQTKLGNDNKNPATCTYTGGYPITSEEVKKTIVQAANQYNVPVEMMSVFLAGEHCRFASGIINVCQQTDDYLAKGNFLDAGVDFYHPNIEGQNIYFNQCPGAVGDGEYSGMFALNAFSDSWSELSKNGNICSINDNLYAMANLISGYGIDANATPEDMKRVAIKWVLGAPQTSDGTALTCQSAMDIADKYAGGAETEICEVTTAAGGCVQKGWLWSVGAYCCAIDKATGTTSGNYCTTDPWVQDIEKVESEGCLLN